MWAPTEGMNQYPPVLPPPPPPPFHPDFRIPRLMTMAPQAQQQQQYFEPTSPLQQQQQHFQKPFAGKGRGRGRGQKPANQIQPQAPKRPAGLAGPWQQNKFQAPSAGPTTYPGAGDMIQKPVTVTAATASAYQANKNSTGITGTSTVDAAAVKRKLLEGLMNIKDESYPKELLDKFSPLKCDLCVAKMNSTMQSKMHYSGKQHQKKVRMFMSSWSLAHGTPEPKRAKLSDDSEAVAKPAQSKSDRGDSTLSLYCKVCDLSFTSALHAEQHYMGRNHQRVMSGQAPLKAGYYNAATGKWQKKPVTDHRPPEDVTGRFGIGTGFVPEPTAEEIAQEEALHKKGRFYCSLCDVGATSQEQLDMHLNGAKHRKMTAANNKPKQQPAPNPVVATFTQQNVNVANMLGTKEQSSAKGNSSGKDLSFFRTPSGKYYCQPCNMSLNSESQFTSHTESKKHKLRQASQKPAMVLTGPKAAQWGDKAINPA